MAVADNWTNFIRIHGGEPGARDMFEKAMGELLKAENPGKEVHVIKAVQGDGGIDVYVQQDEGIDIYQCKFFMDKMTPERWSQVKKSFDKAMEPKGIKVLRWFLCIPMEFQHQDITKIYNFESERASYGVKISFVDGNEIINRMEKTNPPLTVKYFSPQIGIKKNLYNKLLDRFINQTSEHPSIKMMEPDYRLFPKGLPMINNSKRTAKEGDEEPLSIKDMILKSWTIPDRKHILFVGEGGIGKTVAMLTLPNEEWFRTYKIPVIYIPLQCLDVYEGKLNEYLNDNYRNDLNEIEELAVSKWETHPNLIVLLDGFNEIPTEYKQVTEKCIRIWMDKPGIQIITTSRINFFLNNKFLEYELLPLPYIICRNYLLSAGMEENTIPAKSDNIWKVINVPLMLIMYTQIDKVKERVNDYSVSSLLDWKNSDNATHIIWNYLQVELYRLISADESKSVLSAVAILAIAPFICYEMSKNNCFYVEQEKFQEIICRAIRFFAENPIMRPVQIETIRYKYDRHKKEKPFNEEACEYYFDILADQSGLFRYKEYFDHFGKKEIIYIPVHQNFRDLLAAVFISGCMLNGNKVGTKLQFPEEMLTTADLYVKTGISEYMSEDELTKIWECHRVNEPEKGYITWILMDIIGRKRNYDYSELNFSNLDLSNINLHGLLSRRLDICPLPQKSGRFNNTCISVKNLSTEGHSDWVYSVAFSPNGRYLASGSKDGMLRVWDLKNGSSIVLDDNSGSIRCVSFSSDGRYLASGSKDKLIRIWDLGKRTCRVLRNCK